MTGHDPTDHALAVIAAIFDKPDAKPNDQTRSPPEDQTETDQAAIGPDQSAEFDAAISQATTPDADTSGAEPLVADANADEDAGAEQRAEAGSAPIATVASDLESFTRYGPGPLDALRFKWSLGRGEGGYYVEETIGATSRPIRTGPLSREDAIAAIEARARQQQRRFEELRQEIVSGPSERGDDEDGDGPDDAR